MFSDKPVHEDRYYRDILIKKIMGSFPDMNRAHLKAFLSDPEHQGNSENLLNIFKILLTNQSLLSKNNIIIALNQIKSSENLLTKLKEDTTQNKLDELNVDPNYFMNHHGSTLQSKFSDKFRKK